MTRRADPFRQPRVCACGEHAHVGLTRGFVAFLDPADVPLVAGRSWYADRRKDTVYVSTTIDGGTVRMHGLLCGVAGADVDHRDGDGLNNRRDNLRPCTHAENLRNQRPKRRSKHRIPFKGVYAAGARFRAQIKAEGRHIHLGRFACPVEAAKAYDAAALEHFQDYALTNAALGLIPPEQAA